MYAGLLKEPIEIYDSTITKTSYGTITETMALSYTTRAKVGHIGGSRSVINDEIQIPYTKNFVIRNYVPVQDTSWIKYNNSYYRVTSIDENKDLMQKVITTELVHE